MKHSNMMFWIPIIWVISTSSGYSATDFPCERRKTSKLVGNGNYAASKLAKNSRFVFIARPPSLNFSYFDAQKECEQLGLEIADIKDPLDLNILQNYLVGRSDFSPRGIKFWHSAFSPEDGKWEYGNSRQEPLHFNAFWGLTSSHIPTKIGETSSANRGMLQWSIEEDHSQRSLVMTDAEPMNDFPLKSFLCQFPSSSNCSVSSSEAKAFRRNQEVELSVNLFSDRSDKLYYVSNKQTSNEGGRKLCKSNGMKMLEIFPDSMEMPLLLADINKIVNGRGKPDGVTGFWIGENDLFHPSQDFKWSWLSERIGDERPGSLYSPDLSIERPGWHRYIGKCMGLAVLGNSINHSMFLQPVSCHIPQWVICNVAKDTQTNSRRGPIAESTSLTKDQNCTAGSSEVTTRCTTYPKGTESEEMGLGEENSPHLERQGRTGDYPGKNEDIIKCTKAVPKLWIPHPQDCRKYYRCQMDGANIVPQIKTCPNGQYFHPTRRICVTGDCPVATTSTAHPTTTTAHSTTKATTTTQPTTTTKPMTTTKATTTTQPTTTTKPMTTTKATTTSQPMPTTESVTNKAMTTHTTTNQPTMATSTEHIIVQSTINQPPTTVPAFLTTASPSEATTTTTEVITTETTTPFIPTTTDTPYFPLECKKRGAVGGRFGEVEIKRMGRASKHVHLDYPTRQNTSYDSTKLECEKWNLELPEIKSKADLESIESFLIGQNGKDFDSVYWISGVDDLRVGEWKYTTNANELIKFQRFWGKGPLYMSSPFQGATNVILRWETNTGTKERKLVMIDVSPNDDFFQRGGIICQFPVSNMICHYNSVEESKFRIADLAKNFPTEIGFLNGERLTVYSNVVQKTKVEAVEFCESNDMTLLDLRMDVADLNDLFKHIYAFAGQSSAFWVGANDLFHQETPVFWDWLNNQMVKPWEDEVLKVGKNLRPGRPRNIGNCLVIGIIDDTDHRFYLQTSPCDLPQHAICVEPADY